MPDLQKYVHYVCGFVDFDMKTKEDIPSLMESFVKFCDSYSKLTNYYLIAHDETDVLHIHFIFYSLAQVQVMTYFNKMSDWFVDKYHLTRNREGISIAKCENINSHIKYIVHQDKNSIASGKKRYEFEDIISNVDVDTIEKMAQSKKGIVDAYYLRDVVLDSRNDFEIMVKLGLATFHRFANEIRYMKEERAYLLLEREEERKVLEKENTENILREVLW